MINVVTVVERLDERTAKLVKESIPTDPQVRRTVMQGLPDGRSKLVWIDPQAMRVSKREGPLEKKTPPSKCSLVWTTPTIMCAVYPLC